MVAAWGLRGEFTVHAYSPTADALRAAGAWHLLADETRPPAPGPGVPSVIDVARLRAHGDAWVARSPSITGRDQAEALRGARIFVARSSFPAAAKGEFYWTDLIGLTVVGRTGAALGVVDGLIDNGAQSVLRVRDADAAEAPERLIPFVDAYVDSVDLDARRIVVDWQLDY